MRYKVVLAIGEIQKHNTDFIEVARTIRYVEETWAQRAINKATSEELKKQPYFVPVSLLSVVPVAGGRE